MTTGMTPPSDPYAYEDGAYVLGALSDEERRAFEAHLATCADCRARVAEVRGVPALLTGITAAELASEPVGDSTAGPVPDTLLPGLLRRAGRRSRQRWLIGGLAAAVVACLVALTITLWPSSGGSSSRQPRPFVALGQSPVRATATLVSKVWGTEIDVHCSYAEGVPRPFPYRLRVYDSTGEADDAGSWTVPVGHDMNYQTGTRYPLNQISKLEILKTDGTPILELDTA